MLRWIALVLLIMLVALQVKIWTGNGSMQVVDGLRASVSKQALENQRLQQRNDALAAEVKDLKEGEAAIEERARSELGMIKPGEKFYRVVEDAPVHPVQPATGVSAQAGDHPADVP